MNSGRTNFVAGAILGITVGFSAGHLILWRHFPADSMPDLFPLRFHQNASSVLPEPGFLPTDLGQPLIPLSNALATTLEPGSARQNQELRPPKPATALPAVTAALDQSGTLPGVSPALPEAISQDVQQLLPPTSTLAPRVEPPAIQVPHAQPLSEVDSEHEQSVRSLVETELRDAPAHQREVWFESLKDLSREDAANVLKMWKQFGGPVADDAVAPLQMPLFRSPTPRNGLGSAATTTQETKDSSSALLRALIIRQRNLLNLETPGFKRQVPILLENPQQSRSETFFGVRTRIDLTQGQHQPTESPFDWAIDGPGFFVVTDGQETLYTRNGHWTLDEQKRIVLAGSNPPLRLAGDWLVPEQVHELTISTRGVVSIAIGDGTQADELQSKELGQIQLARFLNPAALEIRPNGLFAATSSSGVGQLSAPGTGSRGLLLQGVLELSNVDTEVEYLAIDDLNSQLTE